MEGERDVISCQCFWWWFFLAWRFCFSWRIVVYGLLFLLMCNVHGVARALGSIFWVGLVYSLCFLGACASFKPRCLNLSKCSSFVFNFMLWDIAVAAMSRSASGMSVPSSLSFGIGCSRYR